MTGKSRSAPVKTGVVDGATPEHSVVPYDESLLECARTQWQFGDWESLARLDRETLRNHPHRAKLALLAAAGLFQLGEQNEAYQFVQLAQDWGCSKRLILQILVSGVHNCLGSAVSLLDRRAQALAHFNLSVRLGGIPGDDDLLTEARATRQFGRLLSATIENPVGDAKQFSYRHGHRDQ